MGLNEYEVTVDGRHPRKTTLLLSDEDAKRMGVFGQKAAPAPANKARTPQNKAKPAAGKPAAAKRTAKKPAAAPAAPKPATPDPASDPDASE